MATFVAVLGLLGVLLGGNISWLISPGPLSVRHGAIHDCGACHTRFASGPIGWLHAAFAEAPIPAMAQPCFACHKLGDHPLSAHGVDKASLVKLGRGLIGKKPATALATQSWTAATPATFTLPQEARGDVACSACHREHRGNAVPLTEVHSAICQTCHVVRFQSLAQGHPDFVKYPFHRRLRIMFDHARHFDQYFAQANKALVPAGCTSCHGLGPARKAMRVKPFETACAGCHLGDIKQREGAEFQGIAVLGVPALDLQTLRAHHAGIGTWPEEADGDLGPFQRFLLAQRPGVKQDLAALGTLSLGDLSHADDAQVAAAGRIAWAIKDLLFDIETKGPAVLAGDAAKGGGGAVTTADLVGGLPPDAVRSADRAWFPALVNEVSLHRAGKPVPMKTPPVPSEQGSATPSTTPAAPAPAGSAPAGPPSQAPIGGTASGSILGGDSGPLGAAPSTTPPAGPMPAPTHESILGGEGGPLGGAPSATPPARPTPSPSHESILGDGGPLGAAPSATPPAGPAPSPSHESILGAGAPSATLPAGPTPAPSQGSILGGQGILGGSPAAPAAAAPPAAPPKPQEPTPIASEAWTDIGGGWYRQDYFLYYRPTGHTDQFLRAWLDLTGKEATGADEPASRLFAFLSNPKTPGACGECHSVDRGPAGTRVVKWSAFRPDPARYDFTMFSHEPHLTEFGPEGCKTCHQIATAPDFSATYKGGAPSVFSASFKPIEKQLCAKCHVEGHASAACTTCHNYHIGDFPHRLAETPNSAAPGAPPGASVPME